MSNMRRQPDLPMIVWSLSMLLIVGAVAGGLMITGGPVHQRALKMDSDRFGDLSKIQYELADYINQHGDLPDTLALLDDLQDENIHDPITKQPYEYRKISKNAFDLCVTFQATTRESDTERYYYDSDKNAIEWKHEAGHHCYTLQATAGNDKQPNGKFRIRRR